MNPTIITDPTAIDFGDDLNPASMIKNGDLSTLRDHVKYQALDHSIDRYRARIREYIARM